MATKTTGMRRGRPPKVGKEGGFQISVRIDPSFVERADALIEHLTAKNGIAVRADVIRQAFMRGIAELEREARAAEFERRAAEEPPPRRVARR